MNCLLRACRADGRSKTVSAMLDLASRGFRMLFDAEWIYLPVSRMKVIVSRQRDGRSCVMISRRQNGNPRGAGQPVIRAKIEFSCLHYSMTKTLRWSPAIAMATSSQGRLQIAATASLDGRTSLRPRPRYSIVPTESLATIAGYFPARRLSDMNTAPNSATRTRWASSRSARCEFGRFSPSERYSPITLIRMRLERRPSNSP